MGLILWTDWATYEYEKQIIQQTSRTPEEYETRIKQLMDALKV